MVTDCAKGPLRKLDVYDRLDDDQAAFMRKLKSGELKVSAGTPILMEGSTPPQLYTVLRGMGLRCKLLPDGNRQVINFVLPGDFVGVSGRCHG